VVKLQWRRRNQPSEARNRKKRKREKKKRKRKKREKKEREKKEREKGKKTLNESSSKIRSKLRRPSEARSVKRRKQN
jgi:hypothetical protein